MRCKVCSNKVRAPGINAALAAGISAVQIARDQTATGFSVGDTAILSHREHYVVPPAVVHPGARGKDLLTIVRDMTVEAIEDGRLDIMSKEWKNVAPGIGAQKGIDQREFKRDDRKTALALGLLLAGGAPPAALLGDGMTIDGEYEVVDE